MLSDIFNCDDIVTVTPHTEINFISLGELPIFLSQGNLSISQAFYNILSR
jgi:hypothetical protein